MKKRNRILCGHGRRFLSANGGVAAVEFALLLPLLLLLYLGSVDLTRALSADRKLSALTASLSDLMARKAIEDTTNDQIVDYFAVGNAMMRPYDANQTGMRITVVKTTGGNEGEVVSSAAANGMAAREFGDSLTLPSELVTLAAGRCIVLAEGEYAFSPLFRFIFPSTLPLSRRSLAIPRVDGNYCRDAETMCAGFSPQTTQGRNCNDRHNSWGTGRGKGGGISNGNH